MPYFPNASDADGWHATNCAKGRGCLHNVSVAPGCPIRYVSLMFNYDQCAPTADIEKELPRFRRRSFPTGFRTGKAAGIHEVLEALVPTGEDGFAQDCPFRKEAK